MLDLLLEAQQRGVDLSQVSLTRGWTSYDPSIPYDCGEDHEDGVNTLEFRDSSDLFIR